MAKKINLTKKITDIDISRFPVKVHKFFDYAGFSLAVHRPIRNNGTISRSGWSVSELKSGMLVSAGMGIDTIAAAIRIAKERIDVAEKWNPGKLAQTIETEIQKHGQANDPAALEDARETIEETLAKIVSMLENHDCETPGPVQDLRNLAISILKNIDKD